MTKKRKAWLAKSNAKLAKKLSPVQIRILNALKEGAYIRVWHQDVSPAGWHCELRSRDNRVIKTTMHMHTFELLQSEKKQGVLLEIKSKTEDEIIYLISKKGLQALEKV